jgi:hypothetical protein
MYPKNNQTYLALIVRNSYPGVHSSQISFPGGKVEPSDKDLEETALRETEEEIGIFRKNIRIIRQCSEIYIPPSNFLVTPFLGYTEILPQFFPNPEEVKKMLEISVKDLLDDNTIVQTTMTTSYATNIEVPAFKIDKYIIWGATAMMLSELKELLQTLKIS